MRAGLTYRRLIVLFNTKEIVMSDKEMIEFSQWMWADTAKMAAQAAGIYAAALGAFWIFVG
jgi:hypothetical protein